MRHVVTIRDVALLSHAVSCMGTADLRDASLSAAPDAAPQGATKEDVARIAASLIVRGMGGDPEAHGLPALTEEQLDRASAAVRRARVPVEGALAPCPRCARLEGELDDANEVEATMRRSIEENVAAFQRGREDLAEMHRQLLAQADEINGLKRLCGTLVDERDDARGRLSAATGERDELALKLAACEASLGEVSEQLAAAQAVAVDFQPPVVGGQPSGKKR